MVTGNLRRLGPDRVRAAAGHAPVEDRVLGVEIAEPPEGAGFECSSQSLTKAHGHDPRMLAPFGRRWVRRQGAASRYSANETASDPTGVSLRDAKFRPLLEESQHPSGDLRAADLTASQYRPR